MLTEFHKDSAININRADAAKGRTVWFQFRDTVLTIEASWLARLRYTHENAVHHGLVARATSYPWCSASWFETTARKSFVETVNRIKIDRVNVYDAYEVWSAATPVAALPPEEKK
jgi:putative transposase